MGAAQFSNRRVARPAGDAPSRSETREVFSSPLFETYVGRIVRRAIAEQFVDGDHQVLTDEKRLIGESEAQLKRHIAATVPAWGMSWRLCKMTVVQHLRRLAKERLEMHDIDEDARDEALRAVYRDDFERLFRASWTDG